MTVTEIATLRLCIDEIDQDFKDVFKRALDIQNDWHIANFPHLPTTLVGRASHCLQQVEDPRIILITANWDAYISSNPSDTVLLHVEGAIFGTEAAKPSQGSVSWLESADISVERFFVDARKKERFLGKVSVAKAAVERIAAPYVVRDSWRVDIKHKTLLECVLVIGWESAEKHQEFSQCPGFQCLTELKQVAQGSDTKHYKILL
ncbi:hypothetical protein B0T14DRAFT_569444 [Immersiella caudata]|uniref:Uncharacterized protein n=1 Tax=Immersiella caudata TaxID=314043 RepID=A0AA40BTS8_9PEZI|nr:hypothetical protein B0T14DRAFT_569444 [Immersiella caudata]